MSGRLARKELLYGGCYAHVISRSIRKLRIFKDADDFEIFKNFLVIEKRRSGFRVYHYCLMQTHFHMVVEIPEVIEFSRSMSRVKSNYASAFHTKYKLSGPIWRERYKSLLIENEGYLLACGQYVERNPVKAGLVQKAGDWLYSSCQYYDKQREDTFVDGYENMDGISRVQMEEEMMQDAFERGSIIGSTFFRFQFFDKRGRV